MRRKVRLTEGDLHRIIKESVRKALTEADWNTYGGKQPYNQYSDDDFSSSGDPYGFGNDDFNDYSLDGYYGTYNNIGILIENDGKPNVQITIEVKKNKKTIKIRGDEAQLVIYMARKDAEYYGSINTSLYRHLLAYWS